MSVNINLPQLKEQSQYVGWKKMVGAVLKSKSIDIANIQDDQDPTVMIMVLAHVSEQLIFSLYDKETGKAMIEELDRRFLNNGDQETMVKYMKFLNEKKKEEETMYDFIARMKNVKKEIETNKFFKGVITEKILFLQILNGLKSEEQIRYIKEVKVPSEEDAEKPKFLDLETLISTANFEEKLFIKQEPVYSITKKKKKKKNKEHVKCFICGEKGHFCKNCPKNSNKVSSQYSFIIDSGSTINIFNSMQGVYNYKSIDDTVIIQPDGSTIKLNGEGNYNLKFGEIEVEIKVFICLKLERNVISVSNLTEKGFKLVFKKNFVYLLSNQYEELIGTKINGLYEVKKNYYQVFNILHERLGHVSRRYGKLSGVTFSSCKNCKGCREGEHPIKGFYQGETVLKTSSIGERVHFDICGPLQVPSFRGNIYWIGFVDDFSRYGKVYCFRNRSEALEIFKKFKNFFENTTQKKIKSIKHDGAGEFTSETFINFLESNGIMDIKTLPYMHQQNGIAERMMRTIMVIARSMLFHKEHNVKFWDYAVEAACYIRNFRYCRTIKKSPYECLFNKKPNTDMLRVWGCKAYVKKEKAKKLDKQSKEYMFIGYGDQGYKFLDVKSKNVISSRNAVFIENEVLNNDNLENTVDKSIFIRTELSIESQQLQTPEVETESEVTEDVHEQLNDSELESDLEVEEISESNNTESMSNSEESSNITSSEDAMNEDKINENTSIDDRGKSEYSTIWKPIAEGRDISPRKKKGKINRSNEFLYGPLVVNSSYTPKSYKQAMKCRDKEVWLDAIKDEMKSLEDNGVYNLVDKPIDKKVIGTRFLFNWKRDALGTITKAKARFIVQGCSQIEGENYSKNELFSPVIKEESLMIILNIATQLNYETRHLDVKTAFLNGNLKEIIFCKAPEYLNTNKVLKLNKGLYGLKQSPRLWYDCVVKCLKEIEFYPTHSDNCVFFRKVDTRVDIIGVHVDDFIVLTKTKSIIKNIITHMQKHFNVKDEGELKSYLGINIERNRNQKLMFLSQPGKILNVIEEIGLKDSKPKSTPLSNIIQLSKEMSPKTKEEIKEMENIPYRRIVGKLLHITKTRPDIATAVSIVSKYNSCYGMEHWKAVKRIVRYLNATRNYCLTIKPVGMILEGYADADWATDKDNRRSRSGYCFYLGNSIITWKSKLQNTISESTMESEYKALSYAVREVKWLRTFLKELGFEEAVSKPTVIYEDNQACIVFSNNPTYHGRAKHVEISYHVTREAIKNGIADVKYCKTAEMKADVFTKLLGKNKHHIALDYLNMKNKMSGGEVKE